MTLKELNEKLFFITDEYNKSEGVLTEDIINQIKGLLNSANEYRNDRALREELRKIFGFNKEEFEKNKISSEVKQQDLSICINKDTIFYDKKVVITGTFDSFPVREDLAQKLKLLGANINSSISAKTNIVCIGSGAGPKKIEKIEQLKKSGNDIRIISEDELKEIINSIFDK